jgi:hypothetical protein
MTTETRIVEDMTDAELAALAPPRLALLRQQTIERQLRAEAELPRADAAHREAILQLKAVLAYELARLKRVMAERGQQPGQARRWADVAGDLVAELEQLDLRGEDNQRLREVLDELRRMTLMSRRRDQDHLRRATR